MKTITNLFRSAIFSRLLLVILLFIGMFIEGGAAMIILAPLLIPTAVSLGIDPVHFGIVMIVNIMIGGLTPPFGSMMFTVCSIVGVRLEGFIKEVWPFIVALLVVLFVVTYSESVALFIPNLFLK